jgi:hypothetical protein
MGARGLHQWDGKGQRVGKIMLNLQDKLLSDINRRTSDNNANYWYTVPLLIVYCIPMVAVVFMAFVAWFNMVTGG